jgi:hypothetical protein
MQFTNVAAGRIMQPQGCGLEAHAVGMGVQTADRGHICE